MEIVAMQTFLAALVATMLATGIFTTRSNAAVKDERYQPITEAQLQQLIKSTPIKSSEHLKIIFRATYSDFPKVCYEQYTQRWKKNPDSAYTNLWRGVAAQAYWWYVGPYKLDDALWAAHGAELTLVARSCFAKVVELQPKSALVNREYGNYLWIIGNGTGSRDEAIARLKKSLALEPNNPRAHLLLGYVFSNLAEPSYNPKQAEENLLTAARLDPSYAAPHYNLADLYVRSNRYKAAQRELEAYLSLTPENYVDRPEVKRLRSQINAGLGKP